MAARINDEHRTQLAYTARMRKHRPHRGIFARSLARRDRGATRSGHGRTEVTLFDNALYYNARIHTMDPHLAEASAMAVVSGRIAAVGRREEAEAALCGRYRCIDLRGLPVVPGFVDCHVHFLWHALGARRLNLDGVTSVREIIRMVAERAAQARPGEWILGHGWNRSIWEDGAVPTRAHLDSASQGHPVALTSKDGHSLWVNSLALASGGVTKDTADPGGGKIERDERTGEPTGILRESAQALVEQAIPVPSPSVCEDAVASAVQHIHELGVVGIHDCEDELAFRTFQTMASRGRLGLRVYMMLPSGSLDSAIELGLMTGFGDAELRIGPVKVFADGALGSQSAALLEPYLSNPESTGMLTTSPEELVDIISRASRAGIAVAVHAIGDRANRLVLDAFESAMGRAASRADSEDATGAMRVANVGSVSVAPGASGTCAGTCGGGGSEACAHPADAASESARFLKRPKAGAIAARQAGALKGEGLRHRIEHAQLVHPRDLARFAALGIIASVQPIHATSDRYMADMHWGKRTSLAYAYRSLIAAGARVAFGSDAPVEAPDPIAGIFAAVTRKRAQEVSLPGWHTEECLSVGEAVRAYTLGAAYASGEEYLKGSISPGKLADFVVLSQDLFAVPPDDIIHTQVLATVIGGRAAFDRNGLIA